MLVGLALCSSYSYSEQVFGVTNNAADFGYNWVMSQILPQQAGLQVNNVFYRYTTIKNAEDEMVVYVQNENAQGDGYIFREVDDWTGLPGNTITKNIPMPLVDINYWGDGSIEVQGKGEVTDPLVVYSYQYDPCFDPQSSPDCPGYRSPYIPEVEIPDVVDPLQEDYIQEELDRKAQMKAAQEEEEERRQRRRIIVVVEEEDERLETLLGIERENEYSIEQTVLHSNLVALRGLPTSYTYSIDGGVYKDTVVLKDSELPDNRSALRVNLAQDIKHQALVNLQYAK